MPEMRKQSRGVVSRWALGVGVTVLCILLLELLVRAFIPVRNVGASFSTYDPHQGKTLKPDFETVRVTPEFTMEFSTNAQGRRGEELPTPHGGILFIGDSFTMGYGVDDGREFPALVRERLAPTFGTVSTVNAGMGNNGNGRALRFLAREGDRIQPRVLVLQVCDNDFVDNLVEGLYSLGPDGELVEHTVPPPSLARRVQRVVDAVPGVADSYLLGLTQQLVRASPPPTVDTDVSTATTSPMDVLTYRLVEKTLRHAADRAWPVIAVMAHFEGERAERMRRLLERYGAHTIRVPMRRERPDLYYEVDAHWNEAGHVFVAERIANHLLANPALLGDAEAGGAPTEATEATAPDEPVSISH